jgi:hypothetical protein
VGHISLGRGRFDASLAEFLGVHPRTENGSWPYWLGSIQGDRFDAVRYGGLDVASRPVWSVTAAPEPVTLLMLAMGGAAAYEWRRRLLKR